MCKKEVYCFVLLCVCVIFSLIDIMYLVKKILSEKSAVFFKKNLILREKINDQICYFFEAIKKGKKFDTYLIN